MQDDTAIESLDFETSIEQRIFQVLTGSSKNPLKFPTARTLQDCCGGAGLVTEINRMGLSLPKLEDKYYQFLLDNYEMKEK